MSSLDEGGFGKVFSGVSALGLSIAIKVLKPTSNFTRDVQTWFNEQSVYLKCLEHPHIITTFDQFVSAKGALIIVMEKAGGCLSKLLDSGIPLRPSSICSIGCQILEALDYIHRINVIHRDVTMKNILWFPNGTFKLGDFGIAKDDVSSEELAMTFIGHRTALPPELLRFGYSSRQSDIYQLGIVLLHLLTGVEPIPATAPQSEVNDMILGGHPRQTAEKLISKYGRLAEIVSIMLRRREAYRYQTAAEAQIELYKEFQVHHAVDRLLEKARSQMPPQFPQWLK